MDDGPADGLELSSLRDRKPLNDGTGCRVFVAGTKIMYQHSSTPLSCFCMNSLFYFSLNFQDGTSNCLKGLMLFLCYLIVAASFYVHSDQDPDGKFFTTELPVF